MAIAQIGDLVYGEMRAKIPVMTRILLTGSNGLLGQKIQDRTRGRREIELITSSRSPASSLSGKDFIYEPLDISDPDRILEIFQRHKPEAIINTAAVTNVNFCEFHQEECRKINIEGLENLVRACRAFDTHLIHLSSDFVFDGLNGPYREEDRTCPVNYYGKSKVAGEAILEKSGIAWSVLRTILVFGHAAMRPQNFVGLVKSKLEKGEPFRAVTDQFRMPTLAEDLADACLSAAIKKARGIFHVSGNELLSIYEFARRVAKTFGFNESLILPTDSKALAEPAKRPVKTGFFLEKASKILSFSPRSLDEGLLLVKKQMGGDA